MTAKGTATYAGTQSNADGWAAAVMTLAAAAVPENCWYLALNPSGTLQFGWSPTGSTGAQSLAESTVPLPLGRQAIRVTLQASTGTVTFYTGPPGNADSSSGWTQLGSPAVAGATSIFAGTAALAVGNLSPDWYVNQGTGTEYGLYGAVYEFELRSGIGGTVVAHPVFTAQTAGVPSFSDGQGNTWTLDGTAELSGRDYRFHGEMSSLPTSWDQSGNDVWTPVTAGGLLRRLGQGEAPAYSTMERAILNLSGNLAPVAYWPCEDSGGSQLGSAIGGPAMQVYGTPDFGADSSFACSAALPTINTSAWNGVVPAYTPTGTIVCRFLLDATSSPASGVVYLQLAIAGGSCQLVELYASGSDGGFGLRGLTSTGGIEDTGAVAFGLTQAWVSIEIQPAGGGNVTYNLVMLAPGASAGGSIGFTMGSATAGQITAVQVNPAGASISAGLGHIMVQSEWESLFDLYQPLDAWQGELAADRFARLCSENGLGCRIYGPPASTAAMGAQSVDTLVDLLQECETTDMGQLYEPRQALALGYRPQAGLYNQAPAVMLDYSQAELGGTDAALAPTYDDQYSRNDYTVTQGNSTVSGASYRAYLDDGSAMSISPPDEGGIGDYGDTETVNVAATSQLTDTAWWLVHLGTVDDFRWPVIPVNMARAAVAGVQAAVQACDVGDYIEIINPPDQLPPDPIKQLIAQTVEVLGGFHWTITFTGIPESPYETGIFDDETYGRADTDGSELQSGVSSTATSLTVSTTGPSGILWTTSAGDFPLDVAIDGERMTVTNITGSSSPQTFTVTRSVNGVVKSHSAGADVRLWTAPVYAMF